MIEKRLEYEVKGRLCHGALFMFFLRNPEITQRAVALKLGYKPNSQGLITDWLYFVKIPSERNRKELGLILEKTPEELFPEIWDEEFFLARRLLIIGTPASILYRIDAELECQAARAMPALFASNLHKLTLDEEIFFRQHFDKGGTIKFGDIIEQPRKVERHIRTEVKDVRFQASIEVFWSPP